MTIGNSHAGARTIRGREKYMKILRQLEKRYADTKTMEEYETVFNEHLVAVRRMRDKRALSRLDPSINSVLNARKVALARLDH